MISLIGDVAGQFDCLMRLVDKLDRNDRIILVGDIIDRGPKSREVVEWCMENQHRVKVLMGNHEAMMVDFFRGTGKYEPTIWFRNGGYQTMQSYGWVSSHNIEVLKSKVPEAHIDWLSNLSSYYEEPGLFVSHAPWPHPILGCNLTSRMPDMHLWSREEPHKVDGVLQVFGHNGNEYGHKVFGDYAICVDSCNENKLTALRWPSLVIEQERY